MSNRIKVIERDYPLRQMLDHCPEKGYFRGKGKHADYCKLVKNIGKCPHFVEGMTEEDPKTHKEYPLCLTESS